MALADRARNEPRDLYDLWHLVSHGGIDLASLVPAITAKLAFRNVEPAGIQVAHHEEGAEAESSVVCSSRQPDVRVAAVRPGIPGVPSRAAAIRPAISQRCTCRPEPSAPVEAGLGQEQRSCRTTVETSVFHL